MSKAFGFIIGIVEIVVGVLVEFPTAGTSTALIIGGIAAIAGSALQLLLARAPQSLQTDQTIKANVRGTTQTHNVIFGKARVGGIIFKLGTYAQPGQDSANNLFIAIAHSITHAGGCDGIERIWLDDRELPLSFLSSSTVSGVQTTQVISGPTTGKMNVVTYPGTATQAADSNIILSGLGTSTDTARGICYSVFNLYRDPNDNEGFSKAFQGHIPQLTVELRGQKCYDPRLDSTAGGAGSQRVAAPTTWSFSDNPAICAATYMIMAIADGGIGVPASEIDFTSVAAAANICDQTITTPVGTQKRFRVSAALSTSAKRNDNLSKILDAMLGVAVRIGATYRIYAGAYATPADAIDETWLSGSVNVSPKTELTQLYNAVRITYPDELQGYRNIEAAPYLNAAYETQDGGGRLFRDVTFPTSPNAYQSQYLGAITGAKSRRQMQVTLQLNWRGLNIDPWQTVSINLATLPQLAGRTFRVTGWNWTNSGPSVRLSEDGSADYALPSFQLAIIPSPTTDAIYNTPARVAGLTATAVADGVNLRWIELLGTFQDRKVISRSPAGANTYSVIGNTFSTTYHDAFTTGISYDYKVNVISPFGITSADSNVANSSGKTVANGATVGGTLGVDVRITPGGGILTNLDQFPDGTSYNRQLAAYTNAGRPLIDFSHGFHLNKNLDYVADSGTYGRVVQSALQGNSLRSISSGKNAIKNGSFDQRTIGFGSGAGTIAAGVTFMDGWDTTGGDATNVGLYPQDVVAIVNEPNGFGGGNNLQLRVPPSTLITVNSNTFHTLGAQSDPIYLKAGDPYYVSWQRQVDSAYPTETGFTFIARFMLAFFNSAGALNTIGGVGYAYLDATAVTGTAYALQSLTGTVPAGTAYARVYVVLFFRNATAANITTTAFNAVYRVDDIKVIQPSNLDNEVFDGANYARILGSQLQLGFHKLTVAGSGMQVGDQRNLTQNNNSGYALQSAVPLSASSSGAISVIAHNQSIGSASISYAAVANAITGLAVGTAYYVYTDDPTYAGGARSYAATTSGATAYASDGRYVLGKVTIPTSGTGGPAPSGCVGVAMYIENGKLAGAAMVGDIMTVRNDRGEFCKAHISAVEFEMVDCVAIYATDGSVLECSIDTPFTLQDGKIKRAPLMVGRRVINASRDWVMVTRVKHIGARRVAHIHIGGNSYLAGSDPLKLIYSHNPLKP